MHWGEISIEIDPPAGGVKEVASQRPLKKCSPRELGISSLVEMHLEFATHNRAVRGFPHNLGGLHRALVCYHHHLVTFSRSGLRPDRQPSCQRPTCMVIPMISSQMISTSIHSVICPTTTLIMRPRNNQERCDPLLPVQGLVI